jgi:LmbE family N-acetylglucosaminyl deacetylase
VHLSRATADIFIPDEKPASEALSRITHLGIGAHQDDLEFMAFHGILQCHHDPDRWFGGVTCCDGAESSRTGEFAHYSDDEMREVRRREQRRAASVGEYGIMIQLDHPSAGIRNPENHSLRDDLRGILAEIQPEVIYTHNPADKHGTHVAVVLTLLEVLRTLAPETLPERVIGCEVWRDLDWLPDDEKVVMDVSGGDHLASQLTTVFQSQIAGGKRYDLATMGRRSANATFLKAKEADEADQVIFGMDLTPLITDPARDITEFVTGKIERFRAEVLAGLTRRPLC